MKTVSSFSFKNARLIVVLLLIVCNKVLGENQAIQPQIEKTEVFLEFDPSSIGINLNYSSISPLPFTLDPTVPLLQKRDYMTKKRSPFRDEKEIKNDTDRLVPYSLKHPEDEESSLINQDLAHKKPGTSFDNSPKELKTVQPTSTFVALENKKEPFPSHEEMDPFFVINEPQIALEAPETDLLSLEFDDIPQSFDFLYKSYNQQKTVIEKPPLDQKTLENPSYLYIESYEPLESPSHYYPTREKSTSFPSSEGSFFAMELDRDEEPSSPNFDSKLNLNTAPQTVVQSFALSKHPFFPKKHKKNFSSELQIKGTYKGNKDTLEDVVLQNNYSPSIHKIEKPLSKSLPNFSLPKLENHSLPLETEEAIAIAMQNAGIDYEKFENRKGSELNPNELSLPYVKRKEISPKTNGRSHNKIAEAIPHIDSMIALVERTDPAALDNNRASIPLSENTLPQEKQPLYNPPKVPGLDIATTAPSIKEDHLEYVKKQTAPSVTSPEELVLPYIAGKQSLPDKPLMTPKRTFEDLPEVDKVMGLATRHETQKTLEDHPIPHKVKSDLPIFKGEITALQTDMIRSQSKEILEDYDEENRFSAGLIALAKPELEGAPSQNETRALNQSKRFTKGFLTEISPPSHLETISYNNEFTTTAYYSKREDGKGYLFSIKMETGETLNLASSRQHYIFVIDGSSSIKKHRFAIFKEGVGRALSYLREGDSFDIIVADAELTAFSKTPTSWNKESVSKAKRFLIDRNYRGFFINYDAFDLLSNVSNRFVSDKENIVVLITDGHSFKSIQHHKDDFKELVKESKGKFSIFTATASQGNNLSMLDLVSTFNNGELMYSKTNASFSRQLAILIKHIETFVAKDIHVNVTSATQETGIEFYPNEKALPSLYADRPYTIYGSIDELKDFDLILQGRCGDQWINIKQTISFKQAQKASHSIKKGMMLQKAYVCYDYFLQNGDPFFLSEAQNILESHNMPTAVR